MAAQDVDVDDSISAALLVPANAVPGPYTLAAVLYDPISMQNFVDHNGKELGAIAQITITP